MRRLEVLGVRVEMPTQQPLVLLREADGLRRIPIWIGAVEATAIAAALEGQTAARPSTHETTLHLIEALGGAVRRVDIVDVVDGVFRASVHLLPETVVDARPSDAIALALRAGAGIWCTDHVLEAAGMVPDPSTDDAEDEVERFREFLDEIDPDDFG